MVLVSPIGFEPMTPSSKGKQLFNSDLVYLSKKKSDYALVHLFRVYVYWRESDIINLEAVETERRSRLLSFLYSDYTLITPNGEINAFYKNITIVNENLTINPDRKHLLVQF